MIMSKSITSNNPHKVLINKNLRLQGSKFIGNHLYNCKNEVPIFEISTIHALNQIIGHAKFNNNNYGTIYYRGERKLHDSIIPSLYREGTHVYVKNAGINKLLKEIRNQEKNMTILSCLVMLNLTIINLRVAFSTMAFRLALLMS